MNTQTRVVTAGRTDVDEFFRLHLGRRERFPLCPLLAFRQTDDSLTIEEVTKLAELMRLPDETPLMGFWPGQWRTDYFQFTVGDYRKFYEGKP